MSSFYLRQYNNKESIILFTTPKKKIGGEKFRFFFSVGKVFLRRRDEKKTLCFTHTVVMGSSYYLPKKKFKNLFSYK